MKKISEHLGQIIVALAGVALIITACVVFRAPIGNFFSNVVSTETGIGNDMLAQVENPDLSNIGGGSGNGGSGNGGGNAPVLDHSGTIPEGGVYTAKDGTVYEAGAAFPDTTSYGDVYAYGDYEYGYQMVFSEEDTGPDWYYCDTSGWGVRCINNVAAPGPILEFINDEPITSMAQTFDDCTSLVTAPEIPNSVTSLRGTFTDCTSLTTAPVISSGVTDMRYTFCYCTALTTAPAIPSSVTNMYGTFDGCTALTSAPVIPSSVTDMSRAFRGCTSLSTAPVIPSSVTSLQSAFDGCTSLEVAPEIPSSVTSLWMTFQDCTSLTTAPVIPSSVNSMNSTFYGCTALTGTITINANPTSYTYCFKDTVEDIVLTGSSTKLAELAATAKNGNVTVE